MKFMTLSEVASEAIADTKGLYPHSSHDWDEILEPEQIQNMYRNTAHQFVYLSLLSSDSDFEGPWESRLRKIHEAINAAGKAREAIRLLESLGYTVTG